MPTNKPVSSLKRDMWIELEHLLPSAHLQREVRLTILLPCLLGAESGPVAALFINDGENLAEFQLATACESLRSELGEGFHLPVIVAIHSGNDRLQEYGCSAAPCITRDTEGAAILLGLRAPYFRNFFISELLPFVDSTYCPGRSAELTTIAGCSLGGLSAFDIAFHHHDQLRNVGIFSGSLWWRSAVSQPEDPNANRIAHDMVLREAELPPLRYWLYSGHKEESLEGGDRDGDGIIDAVGDTRAFVAALSSRGCRTPERVSATECPEGTHDYRSWSAQGKGFLRWAFGPRSCVTVGTSRG